MTCSEARLAANRKNAALSTGPKTPEGKEQSRRNGLKHGLSGRGIVVHEDDQREVDLRIQTLAAELKPQSTVGVFLIFKLAKLSVRAERAGEQESAAIARRVRHAADDFDEERIDAADRLFDAIHEDPRGNLRRLKKSPEGVDRLLDAWRDLREDLTHEPKPIWAASHMEQAAHLIGKRSEHARASRPGVLSRGVWGDATAMGGRERGEAGEEAARRWGVAGLVEMIDAEVASLQAHRETLDFDLIELDRAEAPSRALFDPSKEATLARRYESEAERGFFKTLREFRQAEAEARAEAAAQAGAAPAPSMASDRARAGVAMGSGGEGPPPAGFDPSWGLPEWHPGESPVVMADDGLPLTIGRAPKPHS